jgi:hypothetical protein
MGPPRKGFEKTELAATMLGVTLHARRLGNERRDVALLGAVAGPLGAGSVAAAVF